MDLLVLLLWIFVIGLVVGAIARLLVPGTGGMGILRTAFAGIAGAFIGGLVVRYLVDPKEDWVTILITILCAAGVVALMAPRRRAF